MAQQSTAQVLPFTPNPPSFGDMLGATKTTETAPKKGKIPTLTATPEVAAAVDQYQEAKAAAKQAEAVMDLAGAVITGFVQVRQDLDGFAGKFTGSYAVMGNQATCKVVYANKFSLSAEDEGQLAGVLGPENFGRMVTKKASVTLKAEVFEDEAAQKKLMGMLGDSFPEFFETKISLGVVEGFNRDIYRVVTPEKLADLDPIWVETCKGYADKATNQPIQETINQKYRENLNLTNEERAQRAAAALTAYPGGDPDDLSATIVDLVVDLMHLAHANDIEPDYVAQMSADHYTAEVEEEAGPWCESCLQAGENTRAVTHSKNPDWAGYDLCEKCAAEYDKRPPL